MDIGHLIKKLRQAKGKSIEEVALEAGTDVGNLSRIERGVQCPRIDAVERLANALQIRMSELIRMAEDPNTQFPTVTDESADLVRIFNDLSPANKNLLVEFAKLLKKQQAQQLD